MRRTILFYFGLIWYKSINLDRDISWWCKPMHAFCLTWIYLAGWMLISNSGFNKQLHWPICRWEKYLITIFLPVTCVRFILLSILFLFSNYLFIYLSLCLSLNLSIPISLSPTKVRFQALYYYQYYKTTLLLS